MTVSMHDVCLCMCVAEMRTVLAKRRRADIWQWIDCAPAKYQCYGTLHS